MLYIYIYSDIFLSQQLYKYTFNKYMESPNGRLFVVPTNDKRE